MWTPASQYSDTIGYCEASVILTRCEACFEERGVNRMYAVSRRGQLSRPLEKTYCLVRPANIHKAGGALS
jgi:hypothetical protein